MTQKEQTSLKVPNSVLENRVSLCQAAEVMGVSERHTRRMLRAYRKDGARALSHGNRGRRPTNSIDKVHIGVDEGTGLVRKAALTPAKVNESEVADELISGDEGAVYGDRAYESRERRKRLKSQGINDRIMHRSHKNQKGLPHWQKRRNQLISPIRKKVEKVFGTLKRSYGYSRVRYRGLARNGVEMYFKMMAYNLRRWMKLAPSLA